MLVKTAGGSRSSNASILTRLHALVEAEQQLEQHTAALHQAQAALQAMATAAASHNRYRIHALGCLWVQRAPVMMPSGVDFFFR